MQSANSALRRIVVLHRLLNRPHNVQLNVVNGTRNVRCYSSSTVVTIGDVSKPVQPAKSPQYVPLKYLSSELSQDSLKNLRWMLQKDVLGQDMFLIGRPGPLRRQLAMQYLELTGRELEYVSLSRDTTEADLKQRREIQAGTATYFDQSAVRAAVEGRILILEGIEKAERNVLPVLNNLLENREMHLEDGRFLIPSSRYDKLLKDHSKEELDKWQLVRVSEDFRVIALGIPVPRYLGNSLDPPFRSRFQARDVQGQSFKDQLVMLRSLAPNVNPVEISQLLSCCYGLLSQESVTLGLPDFPVDNLHAAVQLMELFPGFSSMDAFYRLYPYQCFLGREGTEAVEDILKTFHLLPSEHKKTQGAKDAIIQNVEPSSSQPNADVKMRYQGQEIHCEIPCGEGQTSSTPSFVATPYQDALLTEMLQSHKVRDLCLIGPRGCGKSVTVEQLAAMLNYQIEPIVLYQDMTSRDLIQQRTTLPNGDTIWQQSALVTAALEGKIAILDGIHRIHPSTLAVIHRLVHDREMQLHDGQRLVRHDRYDQYKSQHNLTDQQLLDSGIRRIHPSFRIVALAEPSVRGSSAGQWLTTELLSLFMFHEMRPLALQEETHIINSLYGECSQEMATILSLAHKLRASEDPTLLSLAGSLSTRQLLRIARRMATYPTDSPADLVHQACLARFLPSLARKALDNAMADVGIRESTLTADCKSPTCQETKETVTIGNTTVAKYQTDAKTKVPDILFFDIPQHMAALEWLLQDFTLGEHLLLVGNQGVGKNKLADRLLQLLNRPREYIQLHRDTTVQTLTLQPTVRSGVVVYEDSPLVRAVKSGHVLVVDEADKAPTHVTCILKTLVESGEMILSDGRRIVPHTDYRALTNSASIVPVHPDFRMIVLANRPGFPFLGNDFFGALGDLFSCHSVDNPSPESEVALLKQYGPDVPDKVVSRLVRAFGDLRQMADMGLVQYPYSTREVVNIVKHLQEFRSESLAGSVGNVFDFDQYSQEIQELLAKTLHKHGIPVGANPNNIGLAKEFPLPPPQLTSRWTIGHSPSKTHLAVQQRNLKPKPAVKLHTKHHSIERVEARGMVFSEMQSYWTIPLPEGAIIGGLAITKDMENNQMKDLIHVLTSNPLSVFTMQLSGDMVQQVNLYGVFSPVYGTVPRFTVATISGSLRGSLLVHEEMSNSLILVDPLSSQATLLPLLSTLETAAGSLARTFGAKSKYWRMATDKTGRNNLAVIYELEGNNLEVINIDTLSSYHMTLGILLKNVYIISKDKFLLEDVGNRKFIVSKEDKADPCPSVLLPIEETLDETISVVSCGCEGMEYDMLSQALDQKVSAPNRMFSTEYSFAAVAVGFPPPDMDGSSNEVYSWPRKERAVGTLGRTVLLEGSGQVIRPVSASQVPQELLSADKELVGYLEVTDVLNHKVRYISLPAPRVVSPVAAWMYGDREMPVNIAPTSNHGLVSVDAGGCVRLWETELVNLHKSMEEWRQMIGSDRNYLQLTVEKESGKDVSAPKHGKVDEKNEPHVGGNTWAGGTGGRDTAGLGGKGGPYRLDAGHKVHQVTQEEKDAVPEEVKKAAREMGQKAFKQRLKEIQMSEYDAKLYGEFSGAVSKQVRALRVVLGNLQAKSKERQWMRHQTSGELDDSKLIESLTGEKTIYRRRAEKEPELGAPQVKPKRLKLVIDVSGSMYRFNGYDGRLDREMEAVVMVMEAFQGHETRIRYDVMGHSGESHDLTFVDANHPPQDNKQRLDTIKTMHAHAQFCMSGDHTLEATRLAIQSLSAEDCDEAIVVVLSDANLERYGIPPEHFAKVLTSDVKVNAYAIFIGSLGDQAVRLTSKLPSGRAFVCLDLKDIPQILQQIFAASVLNTR